MNAMNSAEIYKVEFTGRLDQYFRIWITNLALSVITFGIYMAWAKVHTARYLHQHTLIDGRSFDYHGSGGQVLARWVVVIGGVVMFWGLAYQPPLFLLVFIGLCFVLPWFLIHSFAYNARAISWSGVRLDFAGRYWPAFRAYVLYPLLAFAGFVVSMVALGGDDPENYDLLAIPVLVVSAMIAVPIIARARSAFAISALRFRQRSVHFKVPLGPFLKATGLALVWYLLVFGSFSLLLPDTVAQPTTADIEPGEASIWSTIVAVAATLLAVLPAWAVYKALTREAIFRAAMLEGGYEFRSGVTVEGLVKLTMLNTVLIIASLGLMIPWARLNMARYMAENTYILADASLDELVGPHPHGRGDQGDIHVDVTAPGTSI